MKLATVEYPPGTVVWQVSCTSCGSHYALLHAEQDDAPRPRLCCFCGHMAVFHRVDQHWDAATHRPPQDIA